jgi:hypothetical protein
MRIIFTILLVSSFISVHSQVKERTVTGRLTGSDGYGLPGVNIVIKGSAIGTVTDAEGYYSLTAPIGSTLIFSFVGMQAQEVVVTEDNLRPVGNRQAPQPKMKAPPPWSGFVVNDSLSNRPGVFVLSDKTPVYINKSGSIDLSGSNIRKIGRVRASFRGGSLLRPQRYVIKTNTDPVRTGFGLQLTSSVTLEKITQVPELQQQYSQGRSLDGKLQWQGPEKGEIFSWGPLMRTLSFDGSDYAFDNNGQLTSSASNLKPATIYNPFAFFKNGVSNETNVLLSIPVLRSASMIVDAGRKNRTGVIPLSGYEKHNLSLQLKQWRIANGVELDLTGLYHMSTGKLVNRGSNLANIVGSVYRTPVSFDNANGLEKSKAISSRLSYLLPDGTMRSHAPRLVDNPLALANELPDTEQSKRFLGSASMRYNGNSPFSLLANASVDKQWNEVLFGAHPGLSLSPEGRMTFRNESQVLFNSLISPSFQTYYNGNQVKANVSYQYNYEGRDLHKTTASHFSEALWPQVSSADSIAVIDKKLFRNSHEIFFNAQYNRYWINVRLTNRNYFSNTLAKKHCTNIFPSVSASVDLAQLLYIDPVNQLKVYGSVARTIREASLIYSNWAHASTILPASSYHRFFERSELFLTDDLRPETERKFETGLVLHAFNSLQVEFAYFNNLTNQFVTPVQESGSFRLDNTAQVKNYGSSITASYFVYGQLKWGITARWHQNKSIVEKLYSTESLVPIAGFSDVSLVLAKNQPVGAIYGTRFQRNTNGEQMIDNNGYPLVDPRPSIIGYTTPDWALAIENSLQWKRFSTTILFDFKKGAQVWNGTRAALDFLGRSGGTGKLRNTTGHVFEGVGKTGQPNVTPVSFYDPSKDISENFWVRYGFTGVGEQYIEDASWIRLNELAFSYATKLPGKLKEIKFSLVGRNLFLYTPYSGVDPSSSLFGYAGATGLDLFNAPSTRSYSAQVIIKI